VPTFVDRGLSRGERDETSTAVNLSFLDRNPLLLFQVGPHLSLQVLVDHVPDPVLLSKFGSAGNRTQER
jgi:hypothetical protein